jgi:hypothetical protein
MTKNLEIHVDESTEAMARRFIDAWHRAEPGKAVEEHHSRLRAGRASRAFSLRSGSSCCVTSDAARR